MQVATWVKIKGDPDSENGDFVVVSSFPTGIPLLGDRVAASSAASALKYF